jgi:hypothetical protein
MDIKLSNTILFIMCTSIVLFMTSCGAKHIVKGQVIDAKNGKPIEGASIAIHWIGKKTDSFFAPYASGTYTIEKAKDISDAGGFFNIPKYVVFTEYEMGVYRKGYVCWDSQDIFLKDTAKDRYYKKRKGFKVKNNMIIKLEPFTDEYSRVNHAYFTDAVSGRVGGLSGIGEELKIILEIIQKRKEERKRGLKDKD